MAGALSTTHHAMRNKNAWTGNARATIDPNHTAAIDGDHYLTATTTGQRHAVETNSKTPNTICSAEHSRPP